QQHAGRLGQGAGHEGLAVDLDAVAAAHRLAGLGDLAVDLHQALGDALLERTARTEAGLGEHLVQALLDLAGVAFAAFRLEGKDFAGVAHDVCSGAASCSPASSLERVSSSWPGPAGPVPSSARSAATAAAATPGGVMSKGSCG